MLNPLSNSVITRLSWALLAAPLGSASLQAQTLPVSAQQRELAQQSANAPLTWQDLQANAPAHYRVQTGDTLWAIAALYLKSPWRWPQLWGMNLSDIKNPHRIYPGQTLYLSGGGTQPLLSSQPTLAAPAAQTAPTSSLPSVQWTPRTRSQALAQSALTSLKNQLIEPFLSEPLIVAQAGLSGAARIVAAHDERVLLTVGDRAYARGAGHAELRDNPAQKQSVFRVFRNATALRDPLSGAVLGYEAQYLGKALLVRSEGLSGDAGANAQRLPTPATIDIVAAKEEIRVGDRLLPEPEPVLQTYVPHAPARAVDARVVSIYGSAVANAAQNQVVVINKGSRDGLDSGTVLAILKDGAQLLDKTDSAQPSIKLPDERNGLLMVFRPFENLSYALVLEITTGVRVGDHLVNPRP